MKLAHLFWFLYIAALFSSCRDADHSGVEHFKTEDNLTSFQVTVNATVKQNDDFSLYYTTDGSIHFEKIPAVWTSVKGQDRVQQIIFTLPEKIMPTQLRIDLGSNPKQPDIHLKSVKLSFNGKGVNIPGTLIFSYFRPNFKNTKANLTTGQINGIIENGKRLTPSLYPKENPLRGQIDYLTE